MKTQQQSNKATHTKKKMLIQFYSVIQSYFCDDCHFCRFWSMAIANAIDYMTKIGNRSNQATCFVFMCIIDFCYALFDENGKIIRFHLPSLTFLSK